MHIVSNACMEFRVLKVRTTKTTLSDISNEYSNFQTIACVPWSLSLRYNRCQSTRVKLHRFLPDFVLRSTHGNVSRDEEEY